MNVSSAFLIRHRMIALELKHTMTIMGSSGKRRGKREKESPREKII